jgi:hypothetical protein
MSELASRLIYEEEKLYIHEVWVIGRGRGPPCRTLELSHIWRLTIHFYP